MGRLGLAAIWLLFALWTLAFAEGTPTENKAVGLIPEAKQMDLGTVAPGAAASDVITIANPSSEPITVQEVRVSCGCLAAKLGNNTILPGESARLTIRMKTFSVPGITDTQKVWLVGEGRTLLAEIPVAVTTNEIIQSETNGVVLTGGRLRANISLNSTDGLSFIAEPENGFARITSDPYSGDPRDSHTFTLEVLPDSEGRFPRTAKLRTTHPNRRTVDVALYDAYAKQHGMDHAARSTLFQRLWLKSTEDTIRVGRVPQSGVTVNIPLGNWDSTDPPNEVLACDGLTVVSSEFYFGQTATARLELVPRNAINTVIECKLMIRSNTQVRVAQVLGRVSSR